MIKFKEEILPNGLTLITHRDASTPLVVVNILYKVGSRNEHPERTGLAHLFEHLMFGGSKNVPDYDLRLQEVGAENNAFTNTDVTNYYIVLGAENLETALWVESDRMKALDLNQQKLDVQKNVVVEEFKQRYLNVPYGDVWLKLRPLAYKQHPYRWPTIGSEIRHIEEVGLTDVEDFYKRYYSPSNAILTISGNIEHQQARDLAEKWFGDIHKLNGQVNSYPLESKQEKSRHLEVGGDVPLDAIYKAYHMPARGTDRYITTDLMSDLLGRGKSSRLYQSLVKEKKIFNSLNAYITGSSDPGLLVIAGKVNPGVAIDIANSLVEEEVANLGSHLLESEVNKVINQAISAAYFGETELLERSINLSVGSAIGNSNLVNEEVEMIGQTTIEQIKNMAKEILSPEKANTLFYRSNS